jgi:uncharacterized protein YbaP (TraB family)
MNPAYGIDLHFYTQAKDAGKEIVPLETLEYQMGVLTDMSKEDAEALLKSTLDQVAKPDMGLTDLVNAWQEGDVKKLDQLMNDSFGDTPKVQSSLLDRRNENWMPKIVEMIQSGKNAIIIVGAGHLVGERGLVRSLENRGFKVVQQNSSPRLADLRQ